MKTITVLFGLVLAASAAAQGQDTPSGKAASPSAPPKGQLAEVRSLVSELQGHTDKLSDLLSQYRSLVEQRPEPEGSSPEQKKAHDAQLEKWSAALERLLKRLDTARADVVDTKTRLEKAATGELPTSLAKDVAKSRTEADAQRANAEQALAAKRPAPAKKAKSTKAPPPEKAPPPIPDDL
jgi:hypothetical protein